MKTKHIYAMDLHFEHKLWLNQLAFYEKEIELFQGYLGEVASKNTAQEAQADIEHFENQLMLHRSAQQRLKHDIKAHEHSLVNYAEMHPVALDHVHFQDHAGLREQMDQFEKLFREMKMDFRTFLSKWM